jgi:hypothetical protein
MGVLPFFTVGYPRGMREAAMMDVPASQQSLRHRPAWYFGARPKACT